MNRSPFLDEALNTQDIEEWLENILGPGPQFVSYQIICKDLIQKKLLDLSEYMEEEGLEFWETSWKKPDEPIARNHIAYYRILGER